MSFNNSEIFSYENLRKTLLILLLIFKYLLLRFLSTLWPILQDIAHHIQDKLAISFDSSSIGLISYKWFLTIYDKYSSVKTYNEEDSFFLEKNIPFQNIPNPPSACIF